MASAFLGLKATLADIRAQTNLGTPLGVQIYVLMVSIHPWRTESGQLTLCR